MSAGAPIEEPSSAGPPFHVRCARELFEALESTEGAVRLAALDAVQNGPDVALGFGPYQDRDLVAVLLAQSERFRRDLEWMSWIGALAAFHDPRVVRHFASLLASESHTELLFALANYLRSEPLDSFSEHLRAALMQNDCAARARAVASLLAADRSLAQREALRVALLDPASGRIVPLFSAAAADWLDELAGPFQLEAQLELRRQGCSALAALARHWDRHSVDTRQWLLMWAAEVDPDQLLEGVRDVLVHQPDQLLLPALAVAARLTEPRGDLDDLVRPLTTHTDELVRRAAVLACRSGVDWRSLYDRESSVLVKQVCLARIAALEGRDAVPFAVEQLADPDWRIRAAAVEALLTQGEWGVRAALLLLPNANESVRIAIGRLVANWADGDLEDEFTYRCSLPVTA